MSFTDVYLGTATHLPLGSDCHCGDTNASGCAAVDPVGLERTRFYPRQLVGPDELTQDQMWMRDKLRRHNRLLHGWGIVCGCEVRQPRDAKGRPRPWTVVVSAGDVLGPFGDEIVVSGATDFDLRMEESASGDCMQPVDPWCADVRVERRPRRTLYLAIRYDERLTRPVRAIGACGCSGEDHACEYTRVREGFALAVLDELPGAYREADKENNGKDSGVLAGVLRCSPEFAESVRPCPPCPEDPWVVLADIVADADGSLTIDQVSHRRYVASFGAFWFACRPAQAISEPVGVWSPKQKLRLLDQIDPSTVAVLEERHGGLLEAVMAADATAIKGIGKRSAVGRLVQGRTIAEIASVDRDEFVAEALAAGGISEARARSVWDLASSVVTTVRGET